MTASDARSDLPKAVIDLAQDDGAAIDRDAAGAGAEGELVLTDVVVDANNEVVVFNDSGLRTLAIRTEAAVTAEGRTQKHVTAGGEDVSGFRYVVFDNGVRLYYPEGLELMLDRDGPAK